MNRIGSGWWLLSPIVVVSIVCAALPFKGWPAADAGNTFVRQIHEQFCWTLAVVTVLFLGLHAAISYAVLFRSKRLASVDECDRANDCSSIRMPAASMIVSASLLLFLAATQLEVYLDLRWDRDRAEEMVASTVAEVTACQFEWRIRYPALRRRFVTREQVVAWLESPQIDDLYTVNDLHVPADRASVIWLTSADVQHSFCVPNLRIHQDVVPGQRSLVQVAVNRTLNVAERQNVAFDLLCGEFCGVGHHSMRGRLVVETEASFHDYLRSLQARQADDGLAETVDSPTSVRIQGDDR